MMRDACNAVQWFGNIKGNDFELSLMRASTSFREIPRYFLYIKVLSI